jgi:hypothetical protein
MLRRHTTRTKHILQLGDVEPEDSHAERESDGWEEIEVLSGFIKGWRVLEDGEAAGAEGH